MSTSTSYQSGNNSAPLTPTCISASPAGSITLVSSPREIAAILHLNLPLGVTNEGRESIKKSLAPLPGKQTNYPPSIKQFLAPLSGTLVYKIGELHTIFYLCFLVLLVYLSVFTFVSLIKNTKNTCCYYGFH